MNYQYKTEVMIIDEFKGSEVVTIGVIDYGLGSGIITNGIRAVDPRPRDDGMGYSSKQQAERDATFDQIMKILDDIKRFLKTPSKFELAYGNKRQEIEADGGHMVGKVEQQLIHEEIMVISDEVVDEIQQNAAKEAFDMEETHVFDKMSDPKDKLDFVSKASSREDIAVHLNQQQISSNLGTNNLGFRASSYSFQVKNSYPPLAKEEKPPDWSQLDDVLLRPTKRQIVDAEEKGSESNLSHDASVKDGDILSDLLFPLEPLSHDSRLSKRMLETKKMRISTPHRLKVAATITEQKFKNEATEEEKHNVFDEMLRSEMKVLNVFEVESTKLSLVGAREIVSQMNLVNGDSHCISNSRFHKPPLNQLEIKTEFERLQLNQSLDSFSFSYKDVKWEAGGQIICKGLAQILDAGGEKQNLDKTCLEEKMTLFHELGKLQSTHPNNLKPLAIDLNLEGFNVISMFGQGLEKVRAYCGIIDIQIQRQIEKVFGVDFDVVISRSHEQMVDEAPAMGAQNLFDQLPESENKLYKFGTPETNEISDFAINNESDTTYFAKELKWKRYLAYDGSELDIHNNDNNSGVYHGYTCSSVKFYSLLNNSLVAGEVNGCLKCNSRRGSWLSGKNSEKLINMINIMKKRAGGTQRESMRNIGGEYIATKSSFSLEQIRCDHFLYICGDIYAMLGQLANSIYCCKIGLRDAPNMLGYCGSRVCQIQYVVEAHIQAKKAQNLCFMVLDIHRESQSHFSLAVAVDIKQIRFYCERFEKLFLDGAFEFYTHEGVKYMQQVLEYVLSTLR